MVTSSIPNRRFLLTVIAASVLLLIAGFFGAGSFLNTSIRLLDGIQVTNTDIGSSMQHALYFCLALGIIPWLFVPVHKIGKARGNRQYWFAAVSILLSGALFWYLRILSLQDYHADLSADGTGLLYVFDLEMLRFELHLLIGLLIGAAIATLILNRLNRDLPVNPFRKNNNPKYTKRK